MVGSEENAGALDLTHVVSQYMDPHLVLPLLEFAEMHPNLRGEYDARQVVQAKLEVLSTTNMVDFAMDTYAQLHSGAEPPQDMVEKREKVLLVMRALKAECDPLLTIIDNEALLEELVETKSFTMSALAQRFGLADDVLDSLYEYAKFQFDCGLYAPAAEYLGAFRQISAGMKPEREFFALWGKLAANILDREWDAAMEDLTLLKDCIDSSGSARGGPGVPLNPLQQLQQRTWLIHWSLFIFFNHSNGRIAIIEMFFSDSYLNTIQTNCPHILRYLAAAVIVNRGRRSTMKDLVRVIKEEANSYQDPITQFVECLYVNFDFEGAQDTLKRCEQAIKHDFFLVGLLDEFVESARLTIFETYCRIHQVIDIDMLASKLNMDRDSAEHWIVNLVRNAKLDAKIDSEANQVLMGVNVPSVYEQIVDATKGLMIRTNALASGYERGSAGGMGSLSSGRDGARRGRGGKAWRGGSSGGRGAGSLNGGRSYLDGGSAHQPAHVSY
mmetsp:Transcript_11927/g.32082  ORF Transcript_11927/g.32082 Transcript_11927/m.32082 type:complete len:498 (+) Transcript_11927:29-1522(+)